MIVYGIELTIVPYNVNEYNEDKLLEILTKLRVSYSEI